MPKITMSSELYEQVRVIAKKAGYASPDEFVIHLLETITAKSSEDDQDQDVLERLRGLGYIS